MLNLAENQATCECGASQFAPPQVDECGLCVCTGCARCYRAAVVLVPVPWSAIENEHAPGTIGFYQRQWARNGVAPEHRRTLAEIQASGGRFDRSERLAAQLAAGAVLAVLVLILRAVFS